MTKTNKIASTLMVFISSLSLATSARAEFFDFSPGTNISDVEPGGGTSTAWYYQDIDLHWSGMADGSAGNNPYILFDGTDASTVGHCIQLSFHPPASSPYATVSRLFIEATDSNGASMTVNYIDVSNPSGYNRTRIWVQKTAGTGTLYWHLKLWDEDGEYGSWNQVAKMNLWKLDLSSQADCTTNSGFPWVSFVGLGTNPTVQHGGF